MKLLARAGLILAVVSIASAPLLAFPLAAPHRATLTAPDASRSALADVAATLGLAAAVGMAIRIKDTGTIAKKFVSRASVAGPDYTSGVQNAGQDWENNTKAAEANYTQAVTAAAADGRFGKGVAAAGAAKFVDKATKLGSQRYPTGVAAAEGGYAKGVQPHLDMMKSLDLPARRPKGNNQERANIVAAANRKLKLSR